MCHAYLSLTLAMQDETPRFTRDGIGAIIPPC